MPFLSALISRLPPPVRRSAAGLMLDVKSLPARLLQPERRSDPWQTAHNVGGGDFAQAGREILALLQSEAGLIPASHVLDIGCGTGRATAPLAAFLDPSARYVGFDVSRRAIRACRRRFGATRPDFTFVEIDVANTEYRPAGRGREDALRFPVEDGTIDVAFATSVFSHMQGASIRRYLSETARALRPGGRFVFTAYALTAERIEALRTDGGPLPFQPWRDGAMVIDPRSPERAIAHPLDQLAAAAEAAGFEAPIPFKRGRWLGPAEYEGWQDLFVVQKSRSS